MQQVLLHISLINGIGFVTAKKIVERKPDAISFAQLYDLSESEWQSIFEFSQETAQKMVQGLANRSALDHELLLLEKHGLSWMSIVDPEYPELLRNIYAPPPILYWQGNPLRNDAKRIAVVGSRGATSYGERAINELVPALVEHEFEIVSGGALGADTMAHRAALNSGGATIAVLGSGLLRKYPHSNRKLFDKICENGGTIVTTFALETEPHSGHFPARNRVIAGMSAGCIVIQAALKSGARITAQCALDEGREVFAVPGAFDDALSEGCHALIQEGAALVTNARDVLRAFGHEEFETEVPEAVSAVYSPVQRVILDFCASPRSFDDIVAQSGLEAGQLQTVLFDLQLEGVLQQNFMGMWEKAV